MTMDIEISDDVPVPTETPTRGRKPKPKGPASALLSALKFVCQIQKKNGTTQERYAFAQNGWIATSNGLLTLGHPIDADLQCCPETYLLVNALTRSTIDLSISQLTPTALSITSGAMRVIVPCVPPASVPISGPDAATVEVTEALQMALGAVGQLPDSQSQIPSQAGVLLASGTATGTDGTVLLEAWHGVQTPPLLMPASAAKLVAKSKLRLTALGYSKSSVTFYFENGAFLKSALFDAAYPDVTSSFHTFNGKKATTPPDGLFDAIDALKVFSEDGRIYFSGNTVVANEKENDPSASSYVVDGLPQRMAFNAELLLKVRHAFSTVQFYPESNLAVFFSSCKTMRGMIAALDLKSEVSYTADDGELEANDIPF